LKIKKLAAESVSRIGRAVLALAFLQRLTERAVRQVIGWHEEHGNLQVERYGSRYHTNRYTILFSGRLNAGTASGVADDASGNPEREVPGSNPEQLLNNPEELKDNPEERDSNPEQLDPQPGNKSSDNRPMSRACKSPWRKILGFRPASDNPGVHDFQ
jgi:hypothetical protein